MKPADFDRLVASLAAQSFAPGSALKRLREEGASMIQAIKAATRLFDLDLGEAKRLVARDPSWSSVHARAKPLHDALIEALPSDFTKSDQLRKSG